MCEMTGKPMAIANCLDKKIKTAWNTPLSRHQYYKD